MPRTNVKHGHKQKAHKHKHKGRYKKKASAKKILTTYKGSKTDKQQSRQIVKLARKVDILWRRPEYKWVEEQFNANITSDVSTPYGGSGSNIWRIALPAQGNTCNTRIGDKCYLKRWTLRFKLNGTGDYAGDSENLIRLICAIDKQAVNTENGTSNPLDTESNFVSYSNVLQKTTFTGSAGLVSPLKRSYDTTVNGVPMYDRWTILHDSMYRVGIDSADYSSSAPHQMVKQLDFNLRSMKVSFDKSANLPSDRSLYVFAVSDSALSDHPDGIFYSIVSYTDN